MYHEGGVTALWRGNGAHIMKITSETAIRCIVFAAMQKQFSDSQNLSTFELFCIGASSLCISHLLTYPLEVVKTRLSAYHAGTGMSSIIKNIVQEEGGVKPFYRGLGISLASVVLVTGMNLTLYETAKKLLMEKSTVSEPSVTHMIAAASLSATTAQTVFYPMHTIRSRLIVQTQEYGRQKYNGAFDVFRTMMREEGATSLFKGFLPSLLKAVPQQCASFIVYESLKKRIDRYLGV
jgi:hypothetical protein